MKKLLLTGFSAALFALCGAESPEFYVGVCTHFAQNKGNPELNLDLASQAGIVSIRDEVGWASVEQRKGELKIPGYFNRYLDEAVRRNLRPLVVLDYGNRFYDGGGYPSSPEAIEGFARYCETVVRGAGGRVKLFQIWNEWDGGCGMSGFGRGTAAGYARLLKAVYPRLKKLAPDATFISGSVCTGERFLEELLKLGILDNCDAVSFHAYNYNQFGANTPEHWITRIQKLQQLIRRYNRGKDKPLYITEMGWPNHITATGSTEEESATRLVRLYLAARKLPALRGIWWYDFQDDGRLPTHHEHNFGLVRPDLTPKQPYFAMKAVAARLSRSKLAEVQSVDGGEVLHFRDGTQAFRALVNHTAGHDLQFILETDAPPASPLTAELPGNPPFTLPWGHREWIGNRQKTVAPNRVAVTAGEMPVLLSGELEHVRIAEVRKIPFARADRPQKARLQLPQSYAEARPAGTPAKPVAFGDYRRHGSPQYGGPQDLSAEFSFSYDRDNLHLTVAVTDDRFHQPEKSIADAWRGDGIQLAFRTGNASGIAVRTELDAALIDGKPALLVREAEGDRSARPRCEIDRRGTLTTYRLTLPARLLGLNAFNSGAMLTCSLLVNDNDGQGRKGYLTWGGGIGGGKDPDKYNLLIFQ